jgi:lipopolysaccharide export system protein LptA
MTRRRLEFFVLAFGVVFLGLVAFYFRPGRRPASRAAREGLPSAPESADAGQATSVARGFDYTETVGGKPSFRIRAERTVAFGPAAGLVPNAYALEKVALTVYPEEGQAVTAYADRADYDRRTGAAVLTGNVRWSDDRGASGETARVSFEPSTRTLVIPGAVHFSRGAFLLDAASGRYDVARREATLNGPVRGTGSGADSAGLSELAADSAVYRREQATVELAGHVAAATRSGDRLACERAVLKLQDTGQRLEWARAEGHVTGELSSAAGGPTRPSAAPRRYSGEQGAFLFGADGSLHSLALTGSPAEVDEPGRRVRARSIEIGLELGRARSARAQGEVRIESPDSSTSCERATLAISAAGEIESADLEGNVALKGEDGRSGSAARAVDLPARGVWILTAAPHGSATVASEGSRLSADRIELGQKTHDVRAEGNARAVFTPSTEKGKAPTLVGDPSRSTYGKADRITLDDANRVGTLSGRASLWQDQSSLFGDDMTLNDRERTLVAVGNVRAVLIPAPDPARSDRPASIVNARRLVYREAASEAVFEGGVRLVRGGFRASSDKATALLDAERKIEKIDLTGSVSLADQTAGRTGRADHVIDWPKQEKTVLEGSPAWVVDGEGNRVAGAVLTIAGRGRSVQITAPVGGKTETVHRTKR